MLRSSKGRSDAASTGCLTSPFPWGSSVLFFRDMISDSFDIGETGSSGGISRAIGDSESLGEADYAESVFHSEAGILIIALFEIDLRCEGVLDAEAHNLSTRINALGAAEDCKPP
uniref:Uncharacterized protein n=1 Tax=Amorphochlora amoebiformis TaxID=1561963 RepID=A0A6T6VJK1_9EUKA|mmetsp:Transcript_25384/g.40061  ORF Transcript_25384/g.40061 Transcript_25384/m.40061 type:complete len:115 (+) Transcript_25384:140-484(+)